ncbi:MAG: PAS domain S-box protein [Actinobacteria bacterium]|nr:PAS domain S-box protein [Actinomycetota bacterium]
MRILKRIGLLEAFLLFVAASFVVDTGLSYRAFMSAGEQVSEEVLAQASITIASGVSQLQRETEALLLRAAGTGAGPGIDFRDTAGTNAFLMWYMRAHDYITSVNYGDALGNGYLLLWDQGRWRNRIKEATKAGVVTWAELDDRGNVVSREVRKDDYDPRERPWYVLATAAAGIQWSAPYVFRTTRDPGITASARVDSGKGDIVRVVGVDVMLKDISRLLAELKQQKPELAVYIVANGGQVLASSEEEGFLPYLRKDSPQLPTLSDPGFETLRAAVEAFRRSEGGFGSVDSAGKRFYSVARPVGLSKNMGLSMVLLVPRDSLLSFLEYAGTLKMLLFVVFTGALGAFFVTRYLTPLRRLTAAIRAFGSGSYVPVRSSDREDEVGVLVSEFGRMADDLSRRQEELVESEARYRNLFESVQDGVFQADEKGLFTRANRALADMLGFAAPEELIGRQTAEFWEDAAERREFLAELQAHKAVRAYRIRVKKRDGTPVILEASVVRVEGPAGEFKGTEGILRDVTEAVRAADALRRAADEWRTTFDSMSDFVSVHDNDYRILKVNRAMAEFFGAEPADLLGKRCHELYHGTDFPCDRCPFPETARTGEAVMVEIDDPHLGIPLLITTSPLVGEDGRPRGCVHVARDLSERRRLEEQLRQAQKMEAVGRLAGGVAHDFNNMLSVILGYTNEVLERLEPTGPIYDDLLEVRAAAERSANLTRQLLAFSRRQPVEPKVIDLKERLQAMEGMLRRTLGEDIAVFLDVAPDLWPVRLDPAQFDQVVANLAVNARDAMPEGGRLLLQAGNVTVGVSERTGAGGLPAGEYVVLAVADDGEGMDQETRDHAFEPFFTTKHETGGTGLGLATVYGIVRQNDGFVGVESAPGEGTTITIHFPRWCGGQPQPEPPRAVAVSAGHETVLLVEDERQVRRLAQTILERLGYTVLAVGRPEEALHLGASHPGDIDLLLTDVVMPGMNGQELAVRVKDLRPGLRVLYMSGYPAKAITHRGILDEGVSFLEKPFTPEGLARKVREVLDRG